MRGGSFGVRALVQRLREAAWFADSEEHWGAIRAQIARENHHNILAVSLVFAVMMAIIPLFSPLSAKISAARQWYVIVRSARCSCTSSRCASGPSGSRPSPS